MRENRTYGSEGGEAQTFPTPIQSRCQRVGRLVLFQLKPVFLFYGILQYHQSLRHILLYLFYK